MSFTVQKLSVALHRAAAMEIGLALGRASPSPRTRARKLAAWLL